MVKIWMGLSGFTRMMKTDTAQQTFDLSAACDLEMINLISRTLYLSNRPGQAGP
jgi:hypothetical protein